MPIYDFIEYNTNYSETIRSLWFCLVFNADNVNNNNFKSFKYNPKLLGNTVTEANNAANGILRNGAIAVLLKYLSKF